MPLIKITDIDNTDIRFGLWRINESVDDLLLLNPGLRTIVSSYHSDVRKCEKLAVYSLLFAMTGNKNLTINYDSDGKPQVDGYNVSVSHTKGYAALIVSKILTVAIDIEYFSSRVSKIVKRFMRDDEDSSTVERQLISWSGKETVYKLFSNQHLQYREMRLIPFVVEDYGKLRIDNLKNSITVNACYQINEAYVLTYAYT